jgi:histidine triad (HIT) family protein
VDVSTSADDPNCVFCAIIAERAEASFVHRDEVVVAFMDINPVTPGHILVVPREHLPALNDVPRSVGARMFTVAQQLAAALRASDLRSDGINLFYADGKAALQEVFHAHLHVFPRYPDDGFTIHANWGTKPSREDLDAIAENIRAADTA